MTQALPFDPAALRGLLHLGNASEEVGDAAQQLVWLVEANHHHVVAHATAEDFLAACTPDTSSSRAM